MIGDSSRCAPLLAYSRDSNEYNRITAWAGCQMDSTHVVAPRNVLSLMPPSNSPRKVKPHRHFYTVLLQWVVERLGIVIEHLPRRGQRRSVRARACALRKSHPVTFGLGIVCEGPVEVVNEC